MYDYGELSLEHGELVYRGYRGWTVPLSYIRVIGETFDSRGPLEDEWFLCVAVDNGSWFEAPFDAYGAEAVLDALRSYFDDRLVPKLAMAKGDASGDQSRVMWPRDLQERPMFAFRNRGSNVVVRTWRTLFGGEVQMLAEDVADYIRTQRSPSG